jgi:hypothetical protein
MRKYQYDKDCSIEGKDPLTGRMDCSRDANEESTLSQIASLYRR